MSTSSIIYPSNKAAFSLTQRSLWIIQTILIIAVAVGLPFSLSLYSVSIVLLVLTTFIRTNWREWWQGLNRNPYFWLSCLFLSWVLIGIGYGPDHHAGWADFHKYRKLLYIPLLMPLFVSQQRQRLAVNTFLIAMMALVTLLVLQYLFNQGVLPGHVALLRNSGNVAAGFHSHIETSFLFAFAAYLALEKMLPWQRTISLFYSCAAAAFILFLFSLNDGRCGMVVFLGLWLLFCWHHVPRKYIALCVVGCMAFLIFAYFSFAFFQNAINSAWQDVVRTWHGEQYAGSEGVRLTIMRHTLTLIAEHPWLGYGSGSFLHIYDTTRFGVVAGIPLLKSPHTDYLMVWTQLGLIGLGMYLALFIVLWRQTLRLQVNRYLAQASLLAILIAQCCNNSFYRSTIGTCFVFFAAVFFSELLATYRADQRMRAVSP